MFKRIFLTITVLIFFFMADKSYGESTKSMLLIVTESSWDAFLASPFISSFIPESSVGSMNIRTNHQNKIIEYYGTINAGRRWSYYEVNDMGAVDKGLGDYLNQSGLSTAFFSDKDELIKIIENQYGMTSYRTNDFEKLFSDDNKKILETADVILIDMDLYCTKENQDFLLDFIKKRHVRLYVFCPYHVENKLTPFLFYDSRKLYPGLITSATTRRQGIITNLDIAPSILSYYGIDCSSMVSKGIEIQYIPDAYKKLNHLLEKIEFLNYYRSNIIKIYNFFLISLLIIYFFLEKRNHYMFNIIYDAFIIFALWLPVLFMLTFIRNIYFVCTLWLLFFILVYWMLNHFSYDIVLKYSSLAIFIILVLDSLLGSHLQQQSFLSYDPVIGARFYGVGNEYGGIIIGSLYLLLYFVSNSPYFVIISLAVQFFLAIILGMPFFGANVGATLSLLTGMISFCIHYSKKKMKSPLFYLTITAFVVFWIFTDLFFVEEKSHLGQMVFQSINGNFRIFTQMIWRKLMMNLQLMRYSLWSKLLAFSLFAVTIKFNLKNDFLKKMAFPFIGAMAGGILMNDSGIVLGAAISIYFVFPYLRSNRRNNQSDHRMECRS